MVPGTCRPLHLALALVAVSLAPSTALAQRGVPQSGFPNWQERMVLVLANRSRAEPTADPKACTSTTVRPPLIWVYNYNRAARFHSANMQKTGLFAHASPCTLVSNISNLYPPNGTCQGEAACACVGGTATCNTTCTAWNSRVAMFGSSASSENIAYGYNSPRAVHTGWMNSSGHCSAILGSAGSVGVGWFSNYWTQNFGSGTPAGTLVAGGHEPQFAGTTSTNVEFRANYYNTAGGPTAAVVNVQGTCLPLTLERGSQTNGTWLATSALSGNSCRRYRFTVTAPGGGTVHLPETGSYGVGGSVATCPDWDASVPVACGSTNAPPTVQLAAGASPNPTATTTTAVSVLGADDGGEANLTYTWSATGPVTVSFSPNGSNAAKSATATFSRSGSYQLTVTVQDAGGLSASSQVAVTVVQSLASVTVSPATATVNVNGTRSFAASGTDQFGEPMNPQPSWSWAVSGGGTIDAGGGFTAGGAVGGPHTITATAAGKSGTAQVTVGAGSAPLITAQAAANPNPLAGLTTQLTVSATDDGGQANLLYTWSSSGPGAVSFSPNGALAAQAATATFTRAGQYLLTVTVRDAGNQAATSAVSVIVNQTVTAVAVAPPSATVNLNGTQAFTAVVTDQFGEPLGSPPAVSWAVSGGGTIDQSGLFQAGATVGGPHTVTASAQGRSGTAQLSVSAGSPPLITAQAIAVPNPVLGVLTQLSVSASDDGGDQHLRYTWSAVGPSPVGFSANGTAAARQVAATFLAAGDYSLSVTVADQGGLTASSQVQVGVLQTLTDVRVNPPSATVKPGATLQLTARAEDQFGTVIGQSTVFAWSVSGGGTIDQSGRFIAGATPGGPHTVTATTGGRSGSAQVTIDLSDPPPLTVALVEPSPLAVVYGTVRLGAQTNGDDRVAQVAFTVDGEEVGLADAPPWQLQWDSRPRADGNLTLRALALPHQGLSVWSEEVVVQLSNHTPDTTAPTVELLSPSQGHLAGRVEAVALAADDRAVVDVVFLLDDQLLTQLPAPPWETAFDADLLASGSHRLQVIATDAAGNAATDEVWFTTGKLGEISGSCSCTGGTGWGLPGLLLLALLLCSRRRRCTGALLPRS